MVTQKNMVNITKEQWQKCLYRNYSQYAPDDFQNNLKENNANSYIWEMLLGNTLLNNGFALATPGELQHIGKSERPDICVKNDSKRIWIECCMPGRGKNEENSVLLWEDYVSSSQTSVDLDKSLLRITNVLSGKKTQYEKWGEKGICKKDEPFILAIHGKNLDLRIPHGGFPDILGLLYGRSEKILKCTPDSTKVEYPCRSEILKIYNSKKDIPIPIGYFLKKDYEFIYGILFSLEWWWHDYGDSHKYCFIKNINALNPCEVSFANFAQEFVYGDENISLNEEDCEYAEHQSKSLEEMFNN